ncbi:glutamine-hydrolyzing carbamoyl-phosphate synthase small subunit [Cryomorpha ignava]|uniref:Carbamoyl phosphate synthase small chain n=1 Tax=Cryomorpha ignava TaxID=101383 RepID=A0A7K3WPK6_9FLAO|nr:glutamine-hydrolyzing carbamoyl-phosphate synthase small subunit [Cryomorpha ignava]NEN23476.1 glutamine-hydrolyzing carbamoyl-phosphate synthase small subunit [Cryomorpha ignava]
MNKLPTNPAVLLLADGTVFHGLAAGAIGTTTGEIAFNTGMTGYQEIFTDPSYYGQILVMAASHIGNYGTHDAEIESESVKISGLVVKKFSENFSRVGSTESLQSYFERDGKVAIRDVDTRAIIRHIRNKGAMNAIISSEETDIEKLKKILAEVPSMDGLELSSRVSCKEAYDVGNPDADFRVAVVDYGAKKNIVRCLVERDCLCRVFPMDATVAEMEAWNPDGYMLSNGPGDPSVMKDSIKLVDEIVEIGKPVFGICLGHQLLALRAGLKTVKMFNGHRGINHPVKNNITGKCEITSQNHGFVVDMESAQGNDEIEVTHTHLNDGTLAGIRYKNHPVFSVQYHPESSPGPHDSRYLFDTFVGNMKEVKASVTN